VRLRSILPALFRCRMLRLTASVAGVAGVALALVLPVHLAAQKAAPKAVLPPDFDAYVAHALKEFDTPGLAIAIVKDGQVVLAKGYGVKRLGDPAPIDAHTLFQIASNTKAFTAAGLATLIDQGKLQWDDRVTQFIPDFALSDPYVTREFTVRDMLTHRSGLGLGAGDLLWFHSNYSRHEVVRRIRAAKFVSGFRAAYAYDNVMYIAAGEIFPAITHQSWEDYIQHQILDPLGMTEAHTGVEAVPAGSNAATPHGRAADGHIEIVPVDSVDATAPAGGINANVTDLAKWMMVQLDSGRLGTRRIWSAERTREMWAGQTILPIEPLPGTLNALTPNFAMYGLGWELRDYRGYKTVSHSGGLAGMTSHTELVPSEKLGVVVLTNMESLLSDAVCQRVVDAYLHAPPTDWATALAGYQRHQDSVGHAAERVQSAARAADSKPSLPLDKYAGRYTDAMYGDVTITNEGGHLVLRFSHSPAFTGELDHWQYDTFVAHWRAKHVEDAFVTFALTPQGTVESMKMAAVSPLADFSFDFQDLFFVPAAGVRPQQPGSSDASVP
jgi:CubicO group peptidase (beta-lactamase class C family)